MKFWAVAVKELRQIRRDTRTLVTLIFIPTFFLFLYGYALNFDIRHVPTAIEDRDQTLESRQLVSAFARSTKPCTRSMCLRWMLGPICVSSSRGSPCRICAARSRKRAVKASAIPRADPRLRPRPAGRRG